MQNTRFLDLHGCSCVFGSLSLSFYIFLIFRSHRVYRPNECEWLKWLDLDSYIAGTITGHFHIYFEITNSKCPHFSSVTQCLLTTMTWEIVNFSWSKHTKGSKDHKNASSHSFFFFSSFLSFKNKVSLSDTTVCVDARSFQTNPSLKVQMHKSVRNQQLHFRNVFLVFFGALLSKWRCVSKSRTYSN